MSPPRLADTSRPRLARGVRLREDAARGGSVLLAPERVLKLSATALDIVRRCDGERDVRAITDDLSAIYKADRDRIATDIRSLLSDLAAKRLVEL